MNKQEPEEQRLEDEPMEPAEDVVESSDEPVLTDSVTSEPEDEPAHDSSSEEITETDSVEKQSESEPEPALMDSNASEPESEPALDSSSEEVTETDSVEDESEPAPEPVLADSDVSESESEPAPEISTEEMTETDSGEDEPEPAPAPEPDDDPSDWFVVHCYSGYENKVRHNLEQRIETMGMKDMIFDVVVPTQEEVEVRDGKRRTVERHIFPGYVLVNLILTEESWYVVRNTPGVTGFVGMGNNPTPLRPDEVSQIVKRMEADAPMIKVTFKVGERVRIIDGPFNDFRGMVAEIDMERTKVRVMVSFFGRETPVELDFLQVEKA